MQYMHFNSSCAFCCVANMLELKSVSVSDTELFRAMQADMLLYQEEGGAWQTGAMLQSARWFDLALRRMGFALEEIQNLTPEAVMELNPPFMIGLKRERGGRHAHVLMEREGDKLTFLNPHREGDGGPDLITLTKEECKARLATASTVGALIPCVPEKVDLLPILEKSIENWHSYQKELMGFISQPHSYDEISSARDPLFRALLLDAPEGARICGHREQEVRLKALQGQFLNAMRERKTLRLSEYMDMDSVEAAFAFYLAGLVCTNDIGKFS